MNIAQRRQLIAKYIESPDRHEWELARALRATLDDLERAEARVVALQAVGSTLCGVAWGTGLFYATDPWRKLTSQLDPAAERLLARLRAAEAVCEAAASVITEDGVRQELSAYVMGIELITWVEAWRHSKEMK